MNSGTIRDFLTGTLPALVHDGESTDAGFALPPRSLALLAKVVSALGVRRVFEFGSGQSTRCFLEAGCTVTAIEDSAEWLAQTLAALPAPQREKLHGFQLPLQTVWLGGAPMRSWRLPDAARDALRDADLVLVDSPALPPFREHALVIALGTARGALTIVDDASIPTVARFCRRLAERNDAPHRFVPVDHGLFFCGPAARSPLDVTRSCVETLKAWRRFLHPRSGA